MLLALGLFLALFLSISLALVAEMTRETVHSPRELELMAGAPVLATIPKEKLPLRTPLPIGSGEETDKGTALMELSAWRDLRSRRAAQ
jgi:hypothetical protein